MVSVIGTSSTDDASLDNAFTVYPHPTSSYLYLNTADGRPYDELWSIYNLTGQLIQEGKGGSIDVTNMDTGTYLIRSGVLVTKFMVIK